MFELNLMQLLLDLVFFLQELLRDWVPELLERQLDP